MPTVGVRAGEVVTAVCLALMLLVGGAGTAYPLVGAVGTLVAIALGVWCVGWRGVRLDRLEWALVALAVVVPLAQIVPLPASVWAALPGRDVAARTIAAAGLSAQAMPLSLDRGATVQALLALIPGIAMLIAGRGLDAGGRMTMLRTLLLVAAFSATLGAVQIAVGGGAHSPSFASSHQGQGIGFFTNRNHQAVLLLVALCLLPAARWSGEERRDSIVALGLAVLFIAGVLATASRMALLLLPFVLIVSGWHYRRSGRGVVGLLLLAGLTLALLAWWQGALPRVLARFDAVSDLRSVFWQTSWAALRSEWPTGSGMGSFPMVYPLFENRADLIPSFVNHAHQDYLELLLDAGVAGALGLLLFAGWYIRRAVAVARGSADDDIGRVRIGACWAILVVLLFSAVDYPLRMLSLMALFGLLCALAGPPAEARSGRRARGAAVIGGVVGLLLAAIAVHIGWAEHQRMSGHADAAARFDPWSHAAHADVAAQALRNRRHGDARAAAMQALRLAPTDQRAMTISALARIADGDETGGRRALLAGAALGWRDAPTQTWLFAAYGDAGRMADAAARADALLRQANSAIVPIVRAVIADPDFAVAWARMLAARPPWRRDYLTRLADLDIQKLPAHRDLLARLADRTPEEASAFINRAIALGDFDAAQAVWHDAGGLADTGFSRINPDVAMLGWKEAASGLEASTEQGGTSFRIDRAASGRALVQELLLPPGTYRFTFEFSAEAPLPTNLFAWTVNCASSGQRADGGTEYGRARAMLSLTIPASGCPMQRLSLHLGGAGPGEFLLSRVKSRLDFVSRTGPASTPN